MSKKTIMVVDDIESNRILLKMILEDDYEIIECDSGPACLECLQTQHPDIILLDVNMPEMTGYEVCTEIRKNKNTLDLPILFVSAMDNVEERLAGFEAGGNDYITKPIDAAKLTEKIEYALLHQVEVTQAQEKANDAMNIAMEAMTSSSELGQIIEFVKVSQDITTLEGIAKKICEVAQDFGLKASAVVYGNHPLYINCSSDSMESKLLHKFEFSKDKIVSAGVRTMVRSDSMGLLINDMPIHDESRYGRFKDHLMVLSSICEGRLLSIKAHMSLSDQRKEVLDRVIKVTEQQIVVISKKLAEYDSNTRQVMKGMVSELESTLFKLGLEEDQEERLMGLAYGATDRLDALKGEVDKLDQELGLVLEGLYEVLSNN